MSLSILNNISALKAQTQLAATQASLKKSLNQLSTGSRINSGADDAAGLSIADGMDANILALTQSSRNAADGIGLLQTADGALSQVSAMLNRAITLATQAATGSVTDSQRAAIDNEFQKILAEINAVGSATTFNGAQVFTNLDVTPFLSDGTNGNTISGMSIGTLSADDLGLGQAGASATNTLTLTSNVEAGGTVTIGGTTYTFQAGAPASAGQVQIGGSIAATLQNLAAAVNGTDGVNSANASAAAATTGSAITFTATAVGTAGNGVVATGSLTAPPGSAGSWSSAGVLGGGNNGSPAYQFLNIFFANVSNGDQATIGGRTYTFRTALSTGPTVPNEVLIGGDNYASLNNLADAIIGTGSIGVKYSVGTTPNGLVTSGPASGAGTIVLSAPSGNVGDLGVSTTGSAMTVWEPHNGTPPTPASGSLTLSANVASGSTVTIGATTYTFQAGAPGGAGQVQVGANATATLLNLAAAVNGTDGVNSVNASATASAAGTTITFTAKATGSAGNGVTATGTLTTASAPAGNWSNGGTLGGGVNAGSTTAADLLTAPNAQAALTAISDAIGQVAQVRGTLGAYISQLQAASNVMQTQVQKLSSATSNIRDADVGRAVADMTRDNILQQTGMTAMQQADQAQRSVLKLLQ